MRIDGFYFAIRQIFINFVYSLVFHDNQSVIFIVMRAPGREVGCLFVSTRVVILLRNGFRMISYNGGTLVDHKG